MISLKTWNARAGSKKAFWIFWNFAMFLLLNIMDLILDKEIRIKILVENFHWNHQKRTKAVWTYFKYMHSSTEQHWTILVIYRLLLSYIPYTVAGFFLFGKHFLCLLVFINGHISDLRISTQFCYNISASAHGQLTIRWGILLLLLLWFVFCPINFLCITSDSLSASPWVSLPGLPSRGFYFYSFCFLFSVHTFLQYRATITAIHTSFSTKCVLSVLFVELSSTLAFCERVELKVSTWRNSILSFFKPNLSLEERL